MAAPPTLYTTAPSGHPAPLVDGQHLARSASRDSLNSASSAEDWDLPYESDRNSLLDESRPLPDDWARAFDKASGHHFYVETATKRSIWSHPYDDAAIVESLPDSDPVKKELNTWAMALENGQQGGKGQYAAQPGAPGAPPTYSTGGPAAGTNAGRGAAGPEADGWRKVPERSFMDKLTGAFTSGGGSRDDRRARRAERQHRRRLKRNVGKDAEKDYVARRDAFRRGDMDPSTTSGYDADPFGYVPPQDPYGRPYMPPGYIGQTHNTNLPLVGGAFNTITQPLMRSYLFHKNQQVHPQSGIPVGAGQSGRV